MTKQEKRLVAYHEAGHVVSGWFLEHANPVLKVTIVPRSNGALGFAQHLPKELSLYQQEQLLDMMCMTLGGRAAEQVFFDKISTGAADDLNKVTRLAQAQVSMYGMSKRLGNVSYQMDEQQFIKPFSEATAQTIDEEIRNLISISYERTLALIREKRTEVEKLAEKLLEVETVNHDMIVSILGPRPFTTDAYNEYRKNARKDAEEAQKAALADGVNTEPTPNETNKKGGGPTLRPILDPV